MMPEVPPGDIELPVELDFLGKDQLWKEFWKTEEEIAEEKSRDSQEDVQEVLPGSQEEVPAPAQGEVVPAPTQGEEQEFHESCHSVTFYFMKKDSKRCCDTTTPESIHTKDESKRGSAFVFIFGVN